MIQDQRVDIFLDDEHLRNLADEKLRPSDKEYRLLATRLVDRLGPIFPNMGITLHRVHLYTAIPTASEEEKHKKMIAHLDALKRSVDFLDVNYGRLVQRRGSFSGNPKATRVEQKRVDVQLAVDLVLLAARNSYDIGILVSGDQDFTDAVLAAKDLGKAVGIATLDSTEPSDLRWAADFFIDINDWRSPRYRLE
ncbi:MAG: NYN domain-containing protein [Dehalococcoidia bacterium]|nr:NYN domain-containing protein [Dehalococcoidia bacterium]